MQNPYGGGPPPGGPPPGYGYGYAPPQQPAQPQPHSPAMQPHYVPGQPVANAQFGPQGQPMQPRQAGGISLEPTEKVLYYYRANRIGSIIFGVIMSIVLIPAFGLGLFLLYMTLTDRTRSTYVQMITNKRLLSINGYSKPLWEIRWDDVRGLNKIVGRRYEFGVRNAQGAKFMFDDNVHIVEMVLTKLAENPMLREQSPEVQFDTHVN